MVFELPQAIATIVLWLRRNAAKPRPMKPRTIIAQVDGSGTLESGPPGLFGPIECLRWGDSPPVVKDIAGR